MHNMKKKKKKAKLAAPPPLPQKQVKGKDKAIVATRNNTAKVHSLDGGTNALNRVPMAVNAATVDCYNGHTVSAGPQQHCEQQQRVSTPYKAAHLPGDAP